MGPGHHPGHGLSRRLVLVAVVVVLLVGGCTTAVALRSDRSGDASVDDQPGGPNHPLVLTEGEPFAVSGFEYAAGWSVTQTDTGAFEIAGLEVTNDRADAERLAARLRLVEGNVVVAQAFCHAETMDLIPVGTTAVVNCESDDPLPATWDEITIRDAY